MYAVNRRFRHVVFALAVLGAGAGAHERVPAQTAPLDAKTAILEAFRTHRVVALSEGHQEERGHEFRLSLIRDARFPNAANDILVEFGNSLYQDVIDRFIDGRPVAYDDLKRVWQDTTQAHGIWDVPIYEDFFRSVRAVNATLPAARRLRVLLGDPPVDWKAVRTREDLRRLPDRSSHPADVLIREALARGRRALVIYGAGHLWRQNLAGPNLIERLEQRTGEKAFVILAHTTASLEVLGADPARWPVPSVALTRGSSLENQLDAILYLGDLSGRSRSRLSTSLCSNREYREMRIQRMTLAGNERAAEVLEQACRASR